MTELLTPQATLDTVTPLRDWLLVLPLILPLAGAALLLMLGRQQRLQAVVALLVVAATFACALALMLRVYQSGPVSMTMGKWLPPFGISFAADLFGAAFTLIASGTSFFVLLFAVGERKGSETEGFYPLSLLLLAGVVGSFLTGDLFNLYVWFEVMLIASFGLLAMGGRAIELDATLKYGVLNFLATALFLLALGLLYGALGTLNMADILRTAPDANPAAMTGIAALLLLAFGMKAAVFPVNAWLPASYHAPAAAVSALLAALLTKVGAYALLRTLVVLLPASRDLLEPILIALAAATLVIAPFGAIAETNLRRAFGFLVIGGVGAILSGIALGSEAALAGAGAYIVQAMLSLAALYLVAGLIERQTGQRDTRHMGGLYAASAPLSITFLLLLFGLAGLPPLLGFWPKLMLLEAAVAPGSASGWVLAGALLLNSFLTLVAASRLWSHIFWRSAEPSAAADGKRASGVQKVSVAALATLVVTAGLWPNPLFVVARQGAADLIDPSRYVAAVGLAGSVP